MFTGLIEEIGTVSSLIRHGKALKAEYKATLVLSDISTGDSIAVNGVCQTVTSFTKNSFSTNISQETLHKTTMSSLKAGDHVNLERALSLADRLGGHLVQGHVNGTGTLLYTRKEGEMYRMKIQLAHDLMKYLIPEGSIAVEGISLTAASIDTQSNSVELQIIPHTYSQTVLKYKKNGDKLNIETDLLGRYVESLLNSQRKSTPAKQKLNILEY